MTTPGRSLYAQAMDLYQQGHLSPEALEAYRVASPRNTAPQLTQQTPEITLRTLIDEADLYLATLPGPGVAEVRAGLNRWRAGPVTANCTPNEVWQTHLPAALTQLRATHPALAEAIATAAPYLTWITYDGYDPAVIGAGFAQNHCYASLIGESSAIPAQDYDLGVFLIAPHILYRDHNHAAPELYAPLTGPHGWRFAPNRPLTVKPAHHPIWNPAFQCHATKVGPTPFLALFGWTRDVRPVAQVIPAEDWPDLEALRLTP
jgi:hypothetical protein